MNTMFYELKKGIIKKSCNYADFALNKLVRKDLKWQEILAHSG